ncbi:MAG: UvrD-helicase domain-containing protein [Lentisphaeria bacterium]|nr:UvrD-helicase domain-containing protein [Lentisphaeria bacterium]
MELIYVCKICGRENKIEAEKLLASKELVCENCQHPSALTSGNDTPKRRDESLNMEQERAACYNDHARAILVLTGAGCGKTKTLIARALYLHRELNIPPEKIALLTFTRKAAKEISERLNAEVTGMGDRMFVGTFHRFCLDLMRHHGGYFDCTGFKLIDRDDQTETPGYVKELADNYKLYKQENRLIDFDDILLMTAENLQNIIDFRRLVQNKFVHILVDDKSRNLTRKLGDCRSN